MRYLIFDILKEIQSYPAVACLFATPAKDYMFLQAIDTLKTFKKVRFKLTLL